MSDEYSRLGVQQYYELHAEDYRNAHFPDIVEAACDAADALMQHWAGDQLSVLDLACGSGEAALALHEWRRRRGMAHLTLSCQGADPYTCPAFAQRTGTKALPISFEDVANGYLLQSGMAFDLCVCSFALHLVTERSRLWAVLNALAASCQYLLLLSPHKRPEVTCSSGWQLAYQTRVARVHTRLYKSTMWQWHQAG